MLNITDAEFESIKNIMYEKTGVFLKPTKKPLVVSRLRKRLEDLKLPNFSSYIKLLQDPRSGEFETFINAITTNETYFFRHTQQFNFLYEVIFPEMIQEKQHSSRQVQIWSAACSTGEEPYSIAIACREFFKDHRGWRYDVLASDVNSDVLKEARQGCYPERSLKEISQGLRQKYFQPVTASGHKAVHVEYELNLQVRQDVEFIQHNLLKPLERKNIDVIFLRNVMIYFDQPTKQKVVSLLLDNLRPGGYFFISLSESLNDVKSRLKFLQTGIYRKE